MKRLRLIALTLLGLSLACTASKSAFANILIQIDKPSQTMTVSVNGASVYRWRVSTGATGFSTPAGSYTPFRMEVMHYSQEWDNAGMPHAIFFTRQGHSIHGTDHAGLGKDQCHRHWARSSGGLCTKPAAAAAAKAVLALRWFVPLLTPSGLWLPQSLHNRRDNQPALPWKRLASTFACSTLRQGCASAVAAPSMRSPVGRR
jgi:L,D-transpeptidase catalytic domain